MELVNAAYDNLDRMLQGGEWDQFSALLQGSVDIPTEISRNWNHSVKEITNGIGRLESGGMIRKDEMKDYEAMLIPTLFDIASPETIAMKIRNGRVAARIFSDVQTGKMSMADGAAELREALLTPMPKAGRRQVGTTPGGAPIYSTN